MTISPIEFRRMAEKVDVLTGERGSGAQAAVRIEQFNALREQIAKIYAGGKAARLSDLTSAQVAAPPTANDFNALQADVAGLHAALKALLSSLS